MPMSAPVIRMTFPERFVFMKSECREAVGGVLWVEAPIMQRDTQTGTGGKRHHAGLDHWEFINQILVEGSDMCTHRFLVAATGHSRIDVDACKQGQGAGAIMDGGGNVESLGEMANFDRFRNASASEPFRFRRNPIWAPRRKFSNW